MYASPPTCSFMLIALKLYRCLGHGLKMCILFEYNPHFFRKKNELRWFKFFHEDGVDGWVGGWWWWWWGGGGGGWVMGS